MLWFLPIWKVLILLQAQHSTNRTWGYVQVALLFVAWHGVPHEATWTKWLDALGGWYYQSVICSQETYDCHVNLSDSKWYNRKFNGQMFYSLYAHTRPDFPEYPEESFFHKRLIRADPEVGA